jgi:shikimate kinase
LKTIYLVGFMGSGKTTIGKELSNVLQMPVIDTDKEIVKITGNTISRIFELFGEEYFRLLESSTLHSISTTNSIVTTGGGVVLKVTNRQYMKRNGIVIYLKCNFNIIWERLQLDSNRPLAFNQSREKVESIYLSRLALYEQSDIVIDCNDKSVDTIVSEIVKKIENL